MVKNIKRLSLALIALGLSAPVLADSSPFCVTVPNQQGGFTVGADVLWLRPHTPNFGFSAVSTFPTPLITNTNISVLNPGYHWAFDVMAAYRIPCTGNDISVLWTHYNNSNDSASETHLLPVVPPPNQGFSTVRNELSGSFKYDAVDLDLGQRVNFGDYFNFRIFTGVRGASIKTTVNRTSTEFTPGITASEVFTVDQDSDFKGVGPQMGIEGRYCVGYGFGIDASTTLSALVGRTNSSATLSVVTLPSPITTVLNVTSDKKNRVVPALDMNLGVDYTFNFNNCSRSSLVVQAGYKVIHYWNATSLLVSNSTGTFIPDEVGLGHNNSSVSFDGPYLGIKVNV